MSKRTRKLILLGIAVLGAFAVLFLVRQETSHGRTLIAWLQQYSQTPWEIVLINGRHTPNPVKTEAENAIRYFGTNAVPTLLKLTDARDSALKRTLGRISSNQHLISFHPRTAIDYHAFSMAGFEVLGPSAQPAAPALIELLNDSDPDVRATAAFNLGAIGPEARTAIPMLIKGVSDTNSPVRYYALQSLRLIHEEPQLVIPVMVEALRKPQPRRSIYRAALLGLGSFGPQASNAVPVILPFLTNQFNLCYDATNALEEIDPIAAAQAGVK